MEKESNTMEANLSIELQNKLEAYNKLFEEVKGKQVELDTTYKDFIALKNKYLEEFNDESKKINNTVQSFNSSVNTGNGTLTQINTLIEDARKKLGEIEILNNQITDLGAKINNPESGAEALLKLAGDKKVLIEVNLENSQLILNTINENKTAIELEKEVVKKMKTEVEEWKKEIEGIYNFMNGAGLAHSFSDRKKEIGDTIDFWKRATFISAGLFAIVMLGIYYDTREMLTRVENFRIEMFLFKVTYSSPFVFLLWFVTLQFSRAQRLQESYAFKAATAKALENYTDLLESKFKDDRYKQNILDFVIYSMKNIYKHPSSDGKHLEEKQLEDNSLVNVGTVLKGLNENIFEPVSNIKKDLNKLD